MAGRWILTAAHTRHRTLRPLQANVDAGMPVHAWALEELQDKVLEYFPAAAARLSRGRVFACDYVISVVQPRTRVPGKATFTLTTADELWRAARGGGVQAVHAAVAQAALAAHDEKARAIEALESGHLQVQDWEWHGDGFRHWRSWGMRQGVCLPLCRAPLLCNPPTAREHAPPISRLSTPQTNAQEVQRAFFLAHMDALWKEHLQATSFLQRAVGLRSHGQVPGAAWWEQESGMWTRWEPRRTPRRLARLRCWGYSWGGKQLRLGHPPSLLSMPAPLRSARSTGGIQAGDARSV